MQSCSIEILIKISLTVITFISFLYMTITYYFDKKKYLGFWSVGLGLFFINYTILVYDYYSNIYIWMRFLQMLAYITGNIFIVEGSKSLLDRRLSQRFQLNLLIGAFISVIYSMNIFNDHVVLFAYLGFLFYINLFTAIRFFKSLESSIYNKNFIAMISLTMAAINLIDYVLFTLHNNFLLDLFASAFILIIFHHYSSFIYYRDKINLVYEKEVCFDETFNHSSIGMCLFNTQGVIVRSNKAFCDMLGYTSDELSTKTFDNITHPEDSNQEYIKAQKKINEKNKSFQFEKRYIHKDGSVVWVIVTVSIIKDKHEKIMYYIGQIQDITSYKTMYEQLNLSNEKYEILINCYDNSIAVFDSECRFAVANEYVVNKINEHAKTKYTTSSIIGQRITDICPKIMKNDSINMYRQVAISGKPMEGTCKFIGTKGEERWYDVSITPSREGILVITKDVTERIQNHKAIMENEIKYRSLVEQSLDGILLTDRAGYIIEFNREMERITGITRDEAINSHVIDMQLKIGNCRATKGDNLDYIKGSFERDHIIEDIINNIQIHFGQVYRNDGTVVDVEEFYYPIITEDTKMVCFIFRDITEMKKLQRIKERVEENEKLIKETMELDRLRSEFFANLSHEFRTPLNIILSSNKMIGTLIESSKEKYYNNLEYEKIFKYLKSSKQNCYRLLRLINNIIDITKMDAGFFHSNFQCWNIVSVVEEISQSIADYARNKGIDIIFDTDIEELNILCDADAVERIILNLLSNAIKFTEKDGLIQVTMKNKKNSVQITVQDNGIGIPEEQLPLIFNRFKQVDKSLARRQEGSGIGLSLVKSLVEMHGGTIDVYSVVGQGTTFVITLPNKSLCGMDETAAVKELYDSKVEKVNIEFSDIYF